MATEMVFFVVTDPELRKMRGSPENLAATMEERDSSGDLLAIGVNHRNVDIFHYILNDATQSIEGPCGLFDTWRNGSRHSNSRLTDESFGMQSSDVKTLFERLCSLNDGVVSKRWDAWKEAHNIGKDNDPAFFPECFGHLREFFKQAVLQKGAVVWVAG